MIYVDTNLIISNFFADSNTPATEAWMAQQHMPIAISAWSVAEFHFNVALRVRKKEKTSRHAATVLRSFESTWLESATMLTVTDHAHDRAANWLRDHECSLRPADALHLAIAVDNDVAAIATFDRQLARNAERLGIGIRIVALPTDSKFAVHENIAQYIVTERDVAKAVKHARKRRTEERAETMRMLARG